MPQHIEISDETFAQLQAYAIPLVDNVETVIKKALNALKASESAAPAKLPGATPTGVKSFDPFNPPDLAFTTVVSIELDGQPLQAKYWNSLLLAIIERAAAGLKSDESIQHLVIVNSVPGHVTGNGYKFVEAANISVQGQDANGAWKGISHIAQYRKIPVAVTFRWQNNPKASHPGVVGRLVIEA